MLIDAPVGGTVALLSLGKIADFNNKTVIFLLTYFYL